MPCRRVSLDALRYGSRAAALPPLVRSGIADKAELMRRAVKIARTIRAGGKGWSWRMGIGLRTVWGQVKREADMARPLSEVVARLSRPAPANPASVPLRHPSRSYDRGSYRATTHGW